MSKSKTAAAADKALAIAEAKNRKVIELTPEQMIKELRNLRAGHLHVPMHYVDALLAAYDQVSRIGVKITCGSYDNSGAPNA